MNRSPLVLCLGCGLVTAASVCNARPDVQTWIDPVDAVIRRTDSGNDDALIPGAVLPDLLSVSISGWNPTNPTLDPYTGTIVPAAGAQIFRLDVVLAGLVNPPGPIQFPDNPAQYGPSPVYGFIDFDVDADIDTGGEQAGGRYNILEQLARFGAVPAGPLAERAVTSRSQVDFDFNTPPFYERSGADFTLTLCGCSTLTVVSEGNVGQPNGIFEPGETWIVRGKFFQRSAGYQCASFCFGGFEPGLYEPLVDLRFKHDIATNRTTISLVFPLTMQGAATLTGQPVQDWDFTYGFGNHFSVYEALSDVITAVEQNGAHDECLTLASRWAGRNAANYLNVLNWNAWAIVGTAYQNHPLGASFVWTDAGFAHAVGDMNGDGRADALDRAFIQNYINAVDGTADDLDGTVNGSVLIPNFAANYNVRDINYDGVINQADIALIPQVCPADWDRQNGLNTSDFFAFLEDFFAGNADFNRDGLTNSADFMAFIAAFFVGCP